MKIAIAGCGKVGAALIEQLTKENHDVTIIDRDESRMAYVTDSQDVMTYVGDARSVSVLKRAGVEDCDLVLAMTDDDEVNLVICLVANKIGVTRTIARVRNPVFRDTMPVIEDELGLSMVVNPDLEAAAREAQLLDHFRQTDDTGRKKIVDYSADMQLLYRAQGA